MIPDQDNQPAKPDNAPLPAADYGNASNPSPHNNATPPAENQLLGAHAEKYLREVASIEDVPDAKDQQEMDETIEQAKADSEKK